MAINSNFETSISSLSIYFRGGIRKIILIIGAVALILIYPLYLLGSTSAGLYKSVWFKGDKIAQAVNDQAKNYQIGETQTLPLANGQQDLYVSIDNKINQNIGLNPWVYDLQVLDANDVIIKQNTVRSYLLPGSTTYIVASNVDPKGVKLNIVRNPQTVELPYNPNANLILQEPKISVLSSSINSSDKSDELSIRAVLKNNDIVTLGTVDVLYIIRDTRQSVVGIGTYRFGGFGPNAVREVIVNYPKPKDREAKFVEVRWLTNYLNSDNISI